jgi:DNA-directed RNA polymerase subunit RPC12/RpoP
MTKRRDPDQERREDSPDEIRCPDCGYFIAEAVELEGEDFRIILKVVCRSCRGRLLVKLSPKEVVVGQV